MGSHNDDPGRAAAPGTVWTIGHSDRSLEEFVDLLRQNGIDEVVDVRRLPGSRRHPQFDQDALRESLAQAGIDYRRIESLTGRRNVSREVPLERNAWWDNRSFHNYADHALGAEFATGLGEVVRLAEDRRVALLCSEAVWWRCHRRIIADHLIAAGHPVRHILASGHSPDAGLSTGAVVDGATVTYPAGDDSAGA